MPTNIKLIVNNSDIKKKFDNVLAVFKLLCVVNKSNQVSWFSNLYFFILHCRNVIDAINISLKGCRKKFQIVRKCRRGYSAGLPDYICKPTIMLSANHCLIYQNIF